METLQRTANRGSISTGYDIDNSLKFESANTESLTKSQTSSNRRTWTLSFWFKRTNTDFQYLYHYNVSSGNEFYILLNGETDWRVEEYNSGRKLAFHSVVPLRDTSAWYHLVLACDTTQSTSTDRFKIYLNGVQVNAISGYFSTAQYPTQNYDTHINDSAATISIGKSITASTNFKGYLSEVNFIDGLMKDEEDFGKFDSASGIWQPIEYTGSYGNEGYYLDFSDSANLGDDASGNGKNFPENNITSADQATDTPTNNFCTLNVISAIGNNTYTEGATKGIANAQNEQAEGTFMINKGKWYFEAQNITSTGGMFGFGKPNNWATGSPNNPGNDTSSFAIANDGNVYYNSNTAASGWASYATTDKAMIAVDLDNGFCYFGKNGTWGNSGDPTSGSSGTGGFNYVSLVTNISLGDELVPALRISYTQTHGAMFNFGGYTIMSISSAASDANGYGTFEYAPPSGYYALCSKNLAEYG